jgi:hypothetical protein
MTMSENPSRQAAMASGFAWERRTSGPLNETPISARVRTRGARRSCCSRSAEAPGRGCRPCGMTSASEPGVLVSVTGA